MADYALKITVGLDGVPQVTGGLQQVEGAMDTMGAKTTAATGRMASGMGEVETAAGRMAGGMHAHARTAYMGMTELEMGIMSTTMRVMNLTMAAGLIAAPFAAAAVAIKKGLDVIDEFQVATIQIAAQLTQLQGPKDVAKHYKESTAYAGALAEKLQEIDANSFANNKGLMTMLQTMTMQGVVLDINNKKQVESFTNLSNAIAMYTTGENQQIQAAQEMRALTTGVVDQHSLLSRALDAAIKQQGTYKGGLKEVVDLGRQHGDLLERLQPYLVGINAATGDINKTWSAVGSSMQTAINMITREGFKEAFADIVPLVSQMATYLKEHATQIGTYIQRGWLAIKGLIETVVDLTRGSLWVLFEGIVGLTGKILMGWGLLLSSVLPVIADEFRHLINLLNAVVNLAMSFGLVMLDSVGAVGSAITSVSKAAFQALTGDFDAAGKTLQGMFSGAYVEKFKSNMEVVRGTVAAIKEEWTAMQNPMGKMLDRADKFLATANKAKSSATAPPGGKPPGDSTEYDLDKYAKDMERVRESYRHYEKAFDDRVMADIKHATAQQLAELKNRYDQAFITEQQYLDAKYALEKSMLERDASIQLDAAIKAQKAASDAEKAMEKTRNVHEGKEVFNADAIVRRNKALKEAEEAWKAVAATEAKAGMEGVKYFGDTVKAAEKYLSALANLRTELQAMAADNDALAAAMVGVDERIGKIDGDPYANEMAKMEARYQREFNLIDEKEKKLIELWHTTRKGSQEEELVSRQLAEVSRKRMLIERQQILDIRKIEDDSFRTRLSMASQYTGLASNLFTALANTQDQTSRQGFETAKAFNIGAAVMNTAGAIMNALSTVQPYPLAIAAAATAAATGAIQIATIASTTFGGGGTAPTVSAGSFSGGSAGQGGSVGGRIGAQYTSLQDAQSQDDLQRIAASMENASIAIGKVADGLTKVSNLFTDGSFLALLGGALVSAGIADNSKGAFSQFNSWTINDMKDKLGFNLLTPQGLQQTLQQQLSSLTDWKYQAANALFPGLGGLGGAMFGGEKSLEGQGIALNLAGSSVGAFNYAKIKTDGGWFSGDSHDTYYTRNSDVQAAVQAATNSILSTITHGAVAMGTSVDLSRLSLPTTQISTAGRTAEDINKDLEAWLKTVSDEMAKNVLGLKDFAFYGENAFDALVRLSTSLQGANEMFSMMGARLIPATLEGANAAYKLEEMMGGLDKFTEQSAKFFETFYSDDAQFKAKAEAGMRDLNLVMSQLGMVAPRTREELVNVVKGLDTTTEAGARAYAALMNVTEGADAFYKLLEAQTTLDQDVRLRRLKALNPGEVADLYELQIKQEAELKSAREKGLNTEALAAVQALEYAAALKKASSVISEAAQKLIDTTKTSLSQLLDVQTAALNAIKTIMTGPLANLSPEAAYRQAQDQFTTADAKGLPAAATALLEASKNYNASGAAYQADLQMVLDKLGAVAGVGSDPVLDAVQEQIKKLEEIRKAISDGNIDQLTNLQGILAKNSELYVALTSFLTASTSATSPVATPVATPERFRTVAWAEAGAQLATKMALGILPADLQYDVVKDNVIDIRDALKLQRMAQGLEALPSYDVGTPFVTSDMTANIHQGEMIIDPASSAVLRKYGIKTAAAADNRESLSELKEQNRLLKEAVGLLQAQVKGTVQLVDISERQDKKLKGVEQKTRQAVNQ